MYGTLSLRTIIITLAFGIFLISITTLLFSRDFFPGTKIAIVEFDGYIIEITRASYEGNSLYFSYNIESFVPIDITIEPLIMPELHIYKEEQTLEKVIHENRFAYTERYRIDEDVLPNELIISFKVQDRITRSTKLKKK